MKKRKRAFAKTFFKPPVVVAFAIVIVGVLLYVVISQHAKISLFSSKANEITRETETNKKLLQAMQELRIATQSERPVKLNAAVQAAKVRKDQMLKLADTNPALFLESVFTDEDRKNLDAVIQPEIERKDDFEGQFVEVHGENAQSIQHGRVVEQEYVLKKDLEDTEPLRLRWPSKPENAALGDIIKVDGYRLANKLVAEGEGSIKVKNKFNSAMSDASDGGPLSIHAAQAAYPTKAYGVLAAMVNFKDDTRTPYTPTQINDALGVSQVNYWLNSAYSVAFNRTNKIAGWYTLPINKTCDVYQISTEANKVLMSKGINPNSFDRVIYLFPSQCPWGGKGEMPGKLAWITNNTFINYAMAHEEGHNFGINHANSYTCGTKQIDIPANCTEKEYGEYSSAMGTGDFNAYYFNAAHTTMLNWWNATNNVKVISTGGIYTMNNYLFGETFDTKVRGAKIRKPNTNEYYYLSYRWRDAQYPVADLPAGIKQGLNIVISNDVISRQTKALDMSPGDGDMRNASLKDGQTFTDATNKITIKQISRKFEANDASVTFEVKFN